MPKSTAYLYRQALEELATEPPTTKTALLRSLLSEIEVVLRSGKTHKEIWQQLSEAGLDITCETFCRLIRRARKKQCTAAAQGGKTVDLLSIRSLGASDSLGHDPLVNLKRLEGNRPGFHWRATPGPKES